MANDIITNLHPDNDPSTNLYPNIKKENIPSKSISTDKLDNNVLSLIGSLKPSGTDTSTNILAYTSNKGIYVATDNGYWYYWNGIKYVEGGVYQATEIADGSITNQMIGEDGINLGNIKPSFKTKNLFDVGAIKRKKSLLNGVERNDITSYYIPTKIYVNANEKIYLFIEGNNVAGNAIPFDTIFTYYDSNDSYVSQSRADGIYSSSNQWQRAYPYNDATKFIFVKPFTIPTGVSYMKIQGKMEFISLVERVMVCKESDFDGYYEPMFKTYGLLSQKDMNNIKIEFIDETVSYGLSKGASPSFNDDAIGIIETALNSVDVNKNATLNNKILNTARMSHNSALTIDSNGKGFCVFIENNNGYEDNPSSENCFTTLSIINNVNDLSNTVVTNYNVAKNGDVVGDKTILLGAGEPNIYLNNNLLFVCFSAKLSDNKWYMLYRIFNTSTNTFGNIEIMKIKLNNEYVDFTNDNVASLLNIDNFDKWLSMHSQWAFDGTNYYAGLCAESFISKSCILKSIDKVNWELLFIPNHNSIKAQYEHALIYQDGYLWGAIRNEDISITIYKLNLSDNSVIQYFNFKCANSKPCWYIKSNKLYLAYTTYTNNERTFLNIAYVQTLPDSIRVVSQLTTNKNWYPSIALYGNKIFVSVTTNGNYIYIKEISNPKFTKQKVTNLLEKIINVFSN